MCIAETERFDVKLVAKLPGRSCRAVVVASEPVKTDVD